MNLKRFALRALVVLAVVVALCMFFSGTVRTITTPKVKIVTTKQGKLEQTASLTAKLVFPEKEDFRLEDAMGVTLLVDKLYVRAGYAVKEGDILFTGVVTDYDEKMDKLKSDYDEKAVKLADLERQNDKRVRVTTRTGLYNAMVGTRSALHEKTIAMRVALQQEGVTLTPQPTEEGAQPVDWVAEARGQGASEQLLELIRQVIEAQTAADQAETAFYESGKDWKLAVTDETWKYIIERDQLLDQMENLNQQMVELELLKDRLTTVRAPRDGYITELNVKAGEAYDGKSAAYALNAAEVQPVLRADISEIKLSIQEGSAVNIKYDYREITTQVSAVGLDGQGKKYADIAVTDEMIQAKGGIYGLTLNDTTASVSTRASQSTTLIPASAVRSEGEGNDYVFQIGYKYGSFTGNSMYVTKTQVTVLGRSDKLVSVAEDLYGVQLADKEDRAISDGATVMEYVS